MSFKGFLLKHNLNLKGWDSQAYRGNFPESSSQAMLVGIMLVGRLGVPGVWKPGFWEDVLFRGSLKYQDSTGTRLNAWATRYSLPPAVAWRAQKGLHHFKGRIARRCIVIINSNCTSTSNSNDNANTNSSIK